MIVARSSPVPSLAAAALLAGAAFALRTPDEPVEGGGVVVVIDHAEPPRMPDPEPDMAAMVRAFYATRDAKLAPRVQAWLTERHEGVVDPTDFESVMRSSRRAQLDACATIDQHGGDVLVAITRDPTRRTMDADGPNADVVECIETVASSIAIRQGSTHFGLEYRYGLLFEPISHAGIGPRGYDRHGYNGPVDAPHVNAWLRDTLGGDIETCMRSYARSSPFTAELDISSYGTASAKVRLDNGLAAACIEMRLSKVAFPGDPAIVELAYRPR